MNRKTLRIGALIFILLIISNRGLCLNSQIMLEDWTLLYVDSEEIAGSALKAFDGNPNTYWHTAWYSDPTPHEIWIDLGATYTVSGFRYLPRQDGKINGGIKDYAFYVSENLKNNLKSAYIVSDIMGSDHCPIGIDIDV